MTGFFMRCCKKLSLLLVLSCAATLAFAVSSSVLIKSAEMHLADDYYELFAEIDMSFDEDVVEAINKGVPLEFVTEFQVVSPRTYWFDDEIETISSRATLNYHALSRQYLVTRAGQQKSFETLAEAKDELVSINAWRVVEKTKIEKDEDYKASLLMRLDQDKLPKVLQVEVIGSKDWLLTSPTFSWPFKEQK